MRRLVLLACAAAMLLPVPAFAQQSAEARLADGTQPIAEPPRD